MSNKKLNKKQIEEALEKLKEKAKNIPTKKPVSKIQALKEGKKEAKREFRNKVSPTVEGMDKGARKAIETKISKMKLGYFGKTPDDLLADPRFSTGAKTTYALLDKFSQKARGIPIPIAEISYMVMRRCLGISSDDTLRKYLKELQAGGWIGVVRQGVQMPNKYLVYCRNCNDLYKMVNVHKKIESNRDLRDKLAGNYR